MVNNKKNKGNYGRSNGQYVGDGGSWSHGSGRGRGKGRGQGNNATPSAEGGFWSYNNDGKGRGRGATYTPNAYQRTIDENLRQERGEQERDSSHGRQRDASSRQQIDNDQRGRNDESQPRAKQAKEEDQLERNLLHCGKCNQKYDNETRQPSCLPCGHTFCKRCIPDLFQCLECQEFFPRSERQKEFPVNFTVLQMINAVSTEKADGASGSQGGGSMSCRPKSDVNKSVVTISSNKQRDDSVSSKGAEKSPPQKSPHDSMCMERGKKPTYHCSTCLTWVCDECASIDHSQRNGCYLRPKKEALQTMTKAQTDGANGSIESLRNHTTELDYYNENLDAFSHMMAAAFEVIETEKERVSVMKKEAKDKIENLKDLTESLSGNTTLPEALAGLQQIEDECGRSQHWMLQSLSKILDRDQVAKISKGVLHSSVLMRMMAESEAKTRGHLFAQDTVNGINLMSHMTVEGGLVYVHSLKREATLPKGSRAIPLTSIKTCLDKTKGLAFLNVGWGGEIKGRVLIRLLGDTQRGRQFVALCLGSLGTSLQNSSFHRIWSSGKPGQNIWGGDLKNGNGSGVDPVLKFSEEEKKSVPHSRNIPIVAGLVAGSYETADVSPIFRIYTNDIAVYDPLALSRNVEEVVEPSAFGKVECGLEVLHNAANLKNIHELKIYDCGIVIET